MNSKNRTQIIGGAVLVVAGVMGSVTLDEGKYSLISLLGLVFLLISTRTNKE